MKNSLIVILIVYICMMCSCNAKEDIVSNSTALTTSVVEKGTTSDEKSDNPSTSATKWCKHTDYSLKDHYTSYEDALKDYNVILNVLKEHNASSCRDDEKSTQKIQSDLKRIEEFCNELEKTYSTVKTRKQKEEEIKRRIEHWEEQNYWAEIGKLTTNIDQIKSAYQQILKIQKEYEEEKISFDEYYERIMSIKHDSP